MQLRVETELQIYKAWRFVIKFNIYDMINIVRRIENLISSVQDID